MKNVLHQQLQKARHGYQKQRERHISQSKRWRHETAVPVAAAVVVVAAAAAGVVVVVVVAAAAAAGVVVVVVVAVVTTGPLEAEGVYVEVSSKTMTRVPGSILTAPDPKHTENIIKALGLKPNEKSRPERHHAFGRGGRRQAPIILRGQGACPPHLPEGATWRKQRC